MNLKAVFTASLSALAILVAWLLITHYYGVSGDTRFWCIVFGGIGGGILTGWAVAQSMVGKRAGTPLVLAAVFFGVGAPLAVILYNKILRPPTATAAASTTTESEIQAVKLVEPGPGQDFVTVEDAKKGAKLAAAMGLEQREERPSVSDQFAADLRAKLPHVPIEVTPTQNGWRVSITGPMTFDEVCRELRKGNPAVCLNLKKGAVYQLRSSAYPTVPVYWTKPSNEDPQHVISDQDMPSDGLAQGMYKLAPATDRPYIISVRSPDGYPLEVLVERTSLQPDAVIRSADYVQGGRRIRVQ